MNKLKLNRKDSEIFSLLLILFVSLIFIADPRFFTDPPLRSDDWNFLIEPVAFDSIDFLNFTDRRPFLMSLFAVLSPIFQLNISLYYVVNWLLIFLSGLTVYKTIRLAFPKYSWLGLPVALIFIIYPVNYARTWLITSANTFALLLGLFAILLLLRFSKDGKLRHLGLANILVLISLGTYEAALGIIILASFLMVSHRGISKKRRMWLLTVPAATAFFLLWRLIIQPQVFDVSDYYLTSATLSFSTLLIRYVQGLFIFLFNWVGPLLNPMGDIKYWVFTIGGVVLLGILAILIWRRISEQKENNFKEYAVKIKEAKSLLKICGMGFLFWAAGYIPVIALWQPIFYGDGSRVNFGAIPGASLALAALFGALFTILLKDKKRVQKSVLIAMIPLAAAGMAYQVHGQNIRQGIWQEKQEFWNYLFELVPGIESGTKVVIVIPDYEALGPFEMLPFRGDWEAESALRVLYNDQELFAEYYYIDRPEEADNWQPIGGDLGRFIFVYYDPRKGEIRIIQDPYQGLELPKSAENYDPDLRIIPFEQEMGEFRFLVE